MQVGVLSLMTICLLAACGGGGEDTEDPMEEHHQRKILKHRRFTRQKF